MIFQEHDARARPGVYTVGGQITEAIQRHEHVSPDDGRQPAQTLQLFEHVAASRARSGVWRAIRTRCPGRHAPARALRSRWRWPPRPEDPGWRTVNRTTALDAMVRRSGSLLLFARTAAASWPADGASSTIDVCRRQRCRGPHRCGLYAGRIVQRPARCARLIRSPRHPCRPRPAGSRSTRARRAPDPAIARRRSPWQSKPDPANRCRRAALCSRAASASPARRAVRVRPPRPKSCRGTWCAACCRHDPQAVILTARAR